MPEICEATVISQQLDLALKGQTISAVHFNNTIKRDFSALEQLVGWTISSVERAAKMIVFKFENIGIGERYLISRLGMTGHWKLVGSEADPRAVKSYICEITFSNGVENLRLVYFDTRRFGTLQVENDLELLGQLGGLGADILADNFTDQYVEFCVNRHAIPIKGLLLRPEYFPGVGNWVANEALFRANLNPSVLGKNLTQAQISRLRYGLVAVIRRGVSDGGASLKDWSDIFGNKGNAQNNFNVYGREQQPCLICGEKIRKIKVTGRGTYFCPKCQAEDWKQTEPVSQEFADKMIKIAQEHDLGS